MNQEAIDSLRAEYVQRLLRIEEKVDALIAEHDALAEESKVHREALNAAGQSLATVAMLAGRKTYGMPPIETFMATHEEVRAYAASRSAVALAALTKEATNGL